MVRKIGICGGTFDPIHFGHIEGAKCAYETLNLDAIIFLPSGEPPHKLNHMSTPRDMRCDMVRLALEDEKLEYASISEIEIERQGYSYTIDTLKELYAGNLPVSVLPLIQNGEKIRFYYIIGADVLADLHNWKNSDEVFLLCDFIVLMRPGYDKSEFEKNKTRLKKLGAVLHEAEMNQIDLSSSEIRESVNNGQSISEMVSPSVERYIQEHKLYSDKTIRIDILQKDLQSRLKPSRYQHCLRVMEESVRLAHLFGADLEKCRIAGLLHDCAKDITKEQLLWMDINPQTICEGGFLKNKRVIHGPAGAVLAEKRYGITDETILNAIGNHVTGKPGMDDVSQIVFVADYTEKGREGEMFDYVRNELNLGLQKAVIAGCDVTIQHVIKRSEPLNINTVLTRNYFIEQGE